MEKLVKKWGNSLVLVFTEEEKKIYNINEGTILDITILVINNRKNRWEEDGGLE